MSQRLERDWLVTLTRYFLVSVVLHLIWEMVQLPLYTIWRTGTPLEITFAIAHCTAGDVMIAEVSLIAGIMIAGRCRWPRENYVAVSAYAIALGVSYTIYSERLNLSRSNWAYSELMPVIPGLGVGMSPLLQWLIVPAIAAWLAALTAKRE